MTDIILLEIERSPAATAVVSVREWNKQPFQIAGATHLPKIKQLEWWCDFNGLRWYDPVLHEYLIWREKK